MKTVKQLLNEVANYNNYLSAIRSCFIVIIILLTISMAFTCTLSICMYNKLKPQTQEYTHIYNEQLVPEFTIIDGELPD